MILTFRYLDVFNSPNENPQKRIRLFEVSLVSKFLSIDQEFFAQKYSKKINSSGGTIII